MQKVAATRRPRTAKNAVHRINRMLIRESSGRFASIKQLAETPDYVPTLRRKVLADAYDAAQAARGDGRRACR